MDLGLTGKVAIVTGSARGIGRAIAGELVGEGCRVVINSRTAPEVQAAVRDLGEARVHGVVADVGKPHECERLVRACLERFGKLDILICNVGSSRSVAPGTETAEEWNRILTANLLTASNMVNASLGALEAARGSIVCISSICGVEVMRGAPATYSAAKAAMNAYVRVTARPLAKKGIRINTLAPGNILFDGSVWQRKLEEDPDIVGRILEDDVALRRLGKPEEIASFAAFLASERASFATGALFLVDGGQARA